MQKSKGQQSNISIVATLKAEKEELESSLSNEKMHSLQLKQELSEAENRNAELYKVSSHAYILSIIKCFDQCRLI